jgi:hypothetical protein
MVGGQWSMVNGQTFNRQWSAVNGQTFNRQSSFIKYPLRQFLITYFFTVH